MEINEETAEKFNELFKKGEEQIKTELGILQINKLPNTLQNDVETSMRRCFRLGVEHMQDLQRKQHAETGSKFLDKFIHDQAYGTCIGSGDDMFFVEQVYTYFRQQVPMWREFEKQVRADEGKVKI